MMRKGLTALLVMAATIGLVACGGGSGSESNVTGGGTTGGGSTSNGSLSDIGTTPVYATDHAGYMTGAHASFTCGDTCHAIPLTSRTADGVEVSTLATADRTQICVTCHQAQYNATSLLNHSQHNIGTYCNSCHYSDSFTSHNRAATSSYHDYINTSCASCHSGRQPSTHGSDRASGCESCHSYPDWSNSAGFSHDGVTSGCNASGCHTKHYSGYDCVWCHTSANPGVSFGGWSHNRTDQRACTACHANGTGDDDDGKGDDGKGDDDRTTGWLF